MNKVIIGVSILVIVLLVIIYYRASVAAAAAGTTAGTAIAGTTGTGTAGTAISSTTAASTTAVAAATVTSPVVATRAYTFFQGKDSNGGDIRCDSTLTDNLVALKAACNSAAGCIGFNTNGCLKKVLAPQSSWLTWTSDPNRGSYMLNGSF